MTHSNLRTDLARDLRDESGMALLIAVIVLLLMSALALSSLQHAGDESMGSGSSRRKDATLYAAESGQSWVRLTLENFYLSGAIWSSDITLYNPSMVQDAFGNPIEVSTGKPVNGDLPTTPAAVKPAPTAKPQTKLGNDIRTGGHNSGLGKATAWQSDVTSRDAGNGLVHVQVQYSVTEPGGY